MTSRYPQRIVCLTEESTETLYLLNEAERIVGISGFTVRPPQARKEKPRVSAFLTAKTDEIVALKPDLVIGFSDIQAQIAHDLVKQGLNVWITNQRSIEEILATIQQLACLIGVPEKGQRLILSLEAGLNKIQLKAAQLPKRPRVYFEEWYDPMIAAIRWVSELIEIAGGDNCFAELSLSQGAKGRIIEHPQSIIDAQPDIIIGSWCGKKFKPQHVSSRPGFGDIPAVRNKELYEIKSSEILQPGPGALTDGISELHEIFAAWARRVSQ